MSDTASTGPGEHLSHNHVGPFLMLLNLYGDPVALDIFSENRTVNYWLCVERALAAAQAEVGILTHQEAGAIAQACDLSRIDMRRLWDETRHVGYPILPLVRMVVETLPPGADGRLHYGATTQDIMDTALSLQLGDCQRRLDQLLVKLGNELAPLVARYSSTIMAARTHGQQAVPTTCGAKLAVFLEEIRHALLQSEQLKGRIGLLSLHGAGGTSAAFGRQISEIRRCMAETLDLRSQDVPWHVARDGIVAFGLHCGMLAALTSRFAREIIDLSRTEIGEMREGGDYHRGASSTMPQKVNPIASEAIIGMAAVAGALSSALLRAMEAGHERASGEWQIEWLAVPEVAMLAASCLSMAIDLTTNLQIFPDQMTNNMRLDHGLLMAEAYMMRMAPELGRERAHDIVYQAAMSARTNSRSLREVLTETTAGITMGSVALNGDLVPEDYLGEAENVCRVAGDDWNALIRGYPKDGVSDELDA